MKQIIHKQFKYCFFICLMLAAFLPGKAQYVTIPDTAFVGWLTRNGFSQCLNGNQLDTTCGAVTEAMTLNCSNVPIRDLTGVQYFKNLNSLYCTNDSLYSLPVLPASLGGLYCAFNNLTSLPSFVGINIYTLDCSYNQLTQLPAEVGDFQSITCTNNKLTSLPDLNGALQELYCSNNLLTSLPALTYTYILQDLWCDGNQLTELPTLPAKLYSLNCSNNLLVSLPSLPDQYLWEVVCENNRLTSLPSLPITLNSLWCTGNQLTVLPDLPNPVVPTGIEIDCSNNLLTSLPPLTPYVVWLNCSHNPLVSLPSLDARLENLYCGHTQISSLPDLFPGVYVVDCDSDLNLSCLPQLGAIDTLIFTGCPITCIPDYGTVTVSIPPISSIPFCGIFNASGCQGFWNVSGRIYDDIDNDCIFDANDIPLPGVKVLLDSAGMLLQQTYTDADGYYSFLTNFGNYTVLPDTSALPFAIHCPDSGRLNVSLSLEDSLSYGHDFALTCPSHGFDIGVSGIYTGHFHDLPGGLIRVDVVAGDITELYRAHCTIGISGKVQMIINGPIAYEYPASGGLTGVVSGDTVTFNVSDFGTLDNYTAFNSVFHASSTAPLGTVVCITVLVIPTAGDNNISNNTLSYCFALVDSHDPNEKDVYPTSIDSANQWLTYTIWFQNTGNAPAVNIIVDDTLSPKLDPSTFQLLAYSAPNLTQVFGNVVVFNFPNINLPDTASGDSASTGYVQYRIKTISNLQDSDVISNTAFIYFDSNAAVATNTVTDTVANPLTCVPNGSSITQAICGGDTFYMWNNAYYSNGVYADTFTNVGGCDSIVTLYLTVNTSHDTVLSYTACGSYVFNNRTFTQSGTYYYILQTVSGCDSFVTLHLTINTAYYNTINDTVCGSFVFNNDTITQSGTYYDSLQTVNGCDSIITLQLTINTSYDTIISETICGSFVFNNDTITQSGTYYDSLQTVNGCDSIITLQLTINTSYDTIISETICGSFVFNNDTIIQSGTYYDSLQTINGCDSITTLQLTINTPDTLILSDAICTGDTIYMWGNAYDTTGNYIMTYSSVSGCDSLVILSIVVSPATYDTLSATICAGGIYLVGAGQIIHTQPGNYTDTITNLNGCDSIVSLTLTVTQPVYDTTSASICAGDTFYVGNIQHTLQGNYIDTLQSAAGCDSIVSLALIVNPLPVVSFSWDSMVEADDFVDVVDSNNVVATCGTNGPELPLLGGNPLGGTYFGDAIAGNIFSADSFISEHHDSLTYFGASVVDTVYYAYTNGNGCTTTTLATIRFVLCDGIEQINPQNAIFIYPNPASSLLYIKTEGLHPLTITVYDVDGQAVLSQAFTPALDIHNLSAGVYLLEVNSVEGVARKRWVKSSE